MGGLPQGSYRYLLPELTAALEQLPEETLNTVEELRLRTGQPVEVVARQRFFLPALSEQPGVCLPQEPNQRWRANVDGGRQEPPGKWAPLARPTKREEAARPVRGALPQVWPGKDGLNNAPAVEGGKGNVVSPSFGGMEGKRGETTCANGFFIATPGVMDRMVLLLTGSSFYALEQELGQGYVTLPGGHRAGLCGQAVVEAGRLKTLRHISSINLRFARPVTGAADPLLPYLWRQGRLCHTLLASPPRGGKTTALRDIALALSEGRGGRPPLHVAIADERGEIAGAYEGVPQLPVGCRTDVLTGCPKAEGMMALIRAMAPEVLLTDEIGRPEDVFALQEALNAGVTVIATAHGANRQELLARPCTGELLRQGFFERLLFLNRRQEGLQVNAYDREGLACG